MTKPAEQQEARRFGEFCERLESNGGLRAILGALPDNEAVTLDSPTHRGRPILTRRDLDDGWYTDYRLELLSGEHSPDAHGKGMLSCYHLDHPEQQRFVTGKPLPAFHAHKQEMLNGFVDFSYGGALPRWPLEIFLEISNICDFKCAMCPTFSAINPKRFSNLKKIDRGILAIEDATEPLEEMLKHALIVHAFGYGEPTIHPNFREFIDYLSQFEVMIDFFSHGQHLSQEMCEFLVDRKISRITISFSGANASDYENIYMGGNFQTVLDGLDRLNKTKLAARSSFPEIHVNSIAFNHHIENLVDFVHIMGRRGINQVNIKPLATYDSIPELHAHTSILREQVEGKILSEAKAIGQQYGLAIESSAYERLGTEEADVWKTMEERHKGGAALSRDVVDIASFKELARTKKKVPVSEGGEEESPVSAEQLRFMQNRNTPCFEPLKTFYASFDGKVFPCCFKKSDALPLGSLKSDSGVAIWDGGDFAALRENALENKYRADICAPCLRSNAYPHHHAIPGKLGRYSKWFSESFNAPFDRGTMRRCRELPDNEGILQRRSRSGKEYTDFCSVLAAQGIPLDSVSPETDLAELYATHPRQLLAALKSYHEKAYDLYRGEAWRRRLLQRLPGPSRRTLAVVLGAAFALGVLNSLLLSTPLAWTELGIIMLALGNQALRVLIGRGLLARNRARGGLCIDQLLQNLAAGESPPPAGA
jgi:MoaA/NifB/PqqE/SkfB family radical SAM enzyme